MLARAKQFAAEAHGDQMYGDKPYVYHLIYVSSVLFRFGFEDPVLQASAWLHDVVEDTDHSQRDILTVFGPDVADVVSRVTDREGKNRRERHAKTYPRIAELDKASAVKLADRIANVENCILSGSSGLLNMYRREHSFFRDALYQDRPELVAMWNHLNNLLEK